MKTGRRTDRGSPPRLDEFNGLGELTALMIILLIRMSICIIIMYIIVMFIIIMFIVIMFIIIIIIISSSSSSSSSIDMFIIM